MHIGIRLTELFVKEMYRDGSKELHLLYILLYFITVTKWTSGSVGRAVAH